MQRIFLIFLFGLCFGALAQSGIVPQHAFAAPFTLHRPVIVATLAKKDDDQSDHEASIKPIDNQSAKIYVHSESQAEKRFQSSLSIPWPSISLPDFSFLWKQRHSSQKKDLYDRGQ